MTQHKVTVEPLLSYYWNRELQVMARRIVSYRAVCSCGERGPRRLGRTAARKALDERHGAN